MVLLLLAGLQVERTYGTVRFLAVLVPSWTTGALVGCSSSPHTPSMPAFGCHLRGRYRGDDRPASPGVRWQRTFWIPTLVIVLVLGFVFPASVTWVHM